MLESLYAAIDALVIQTDLRTAEMLKYVSNAFHALKVTFANEIGVFSRTLDVDPQRVMDIFTRDTKLNISSKYLRPASRSVARASPRT